MVKTLMPETSNEFLFSFDRFVDNITNPETIGLIINPNKTLTGHALDLLMLTSGIFQALKQCAPEKLEYAFQGSRNALRVAELYFIKTNFRKAVQND